jgi:hypothetical protein
MATNFTVALTASSGEKATITVVDSINPLPGSDKWSAQSPDDFDVSGGSISSWGLGEADLSGPVGARSIVLTSFSKQTKKGDSGSGEKNYDGGNFPMGDLTWTCTAKS